MPGPLVVIRVPHTGSQPEVGAQFDQDCPRGLTFRWQVKPTYTIPAVSVLLLTVMLMVLPAPAFAGMGAPRISSGTAQAVQSWVETNVPKIAKAFQKAAVETVNLDSFGSGAAGAAVQKLVEPATPMSGLGMGFVLGVDGTFLWNFYKALQAEYSK